MVVSIMVPLDHGADALESLAGATVLRASDGASVDASRATAAPWSSCMARFLFFLNAEISPGSIAMTISFSKVSAVSNYIQPCACFGGFD